MLLNNPEQRQKIGKAGRQLVEQYYSWRQVAADFATLLASARSHTYAEIPRANTKLQNRSLT
jgi:glycosyltransferase involved in cell wall biosynthesis